MVHKTVENIVSNWDLQEMLEENNVCEHAAVLVSIRNSIAALEANARKQQTDINELFFVVGRLFAAVNTLEKK